MNFVAIALIALAGAVGGTEGDEAAALKDRQQFPPTEYWRYYYVTTNTGHPKEEQEWQATALKLVVASTSRQVVVEKCVPVPVPGHPTLFRLDLKDLYWDYAAWCRFVATYPYTRSRNPILLRADWLITHLMDSNEQNVPAYYELLFGKVPKTRDEALAILEVNQDFKFQNGWIEGRSGVSQVGVRWIANVATYKGYAWGTRDVIKLDRDHDMLEHPDGSFKHDGEEWIIGLWKKGRKPDGTFVEGTLQAYFLANGQGGIIQRADVRLVEDHTRFRNLPEIRNPGSCVQCHARGINPGTVDELQDVIKSGVVATADYYDKFQLAAKEKIESFHFGNPKKEISRNNEDYAAIVEAVCGCSPQNAATAFGAVVRAYDRPVYPARAAWELGISTQDLELALAYASSKNLLLPGRIAGLAHKRPCQRVALEPAFPDIQYNVIPNWRRE